MISTHPDVRGNLSQPLVRCIEECYDCAHLCTSCADACLAEDTVQQLRQCIRLNLDCADVCLATGALASGRTGSNEQILGSAFELCAAACRVCAKSASGTRIRTSIAKFVPNHADAASGLPRCIEGPRWR